MRTNYTEAIDASTGQEYWTCLYGRTGVLDMLVWKVSTTQDRSTGHACMDRTGVMDMLVWEVSTKVSVRTDYTSA